METPPQQNVEDSDSERQYERRGTSRSADSDSERQSETEGESDTESEWDDSWDSETESEPEYNRFPDFVQFYECLPASSRFSQLGIETGDKIVMPASALVELVDLQIGYPMMFSLSNPNSTQETHCGVLEFSAPEGTAFLPQWMMKNLQLSEGERVKVSSVALPKGTYIKLQPHTSDFLDITNPKAILEHALRRYTCLTVGDTLVLPYGNKEYRIDVVEIRPEKGVSIIDTDCEVDFAQPHDHKEPQKPAAAVNISVSSTGSPPKGKAQLVEQSAHQFRPFSGTSQRLDGQPTSISADTSVRETTARISSVSSVSVSTASKMASTSSNTKFEAFTGKSYRLK